MNTNNAENHQSFDIVVIGGGPAGTTIASLLVEKGWSVCLIEKDRHPRFHIGESLLPMNLPILQRLGVLEQVDRIGIKKYGADFTLATTRLRTETIHFADAFNKNHPYAYEVKRSEFDHILFNNCRSKGVYVVEGVCVESVKFEGKAEKEVIAVANSGETHHYHCRYVVDASGRDTFLATKFKLKQANPNHNMAAVFGHYENVQRRTGINEGNISVYWFDHGWFWLIPLKNGIMSVGVVCWPEFLKTRNNPLHEFLWDAVQRVPNLASRMTDAKLISPVRAAANYSYASSRIAGDGYLLIGDAYAFVDPVFSSGVYLAMQSAVKGADLVDNLLHNPRPSKQLIKEYQKTVKTSINAFSWFIYRFTSPALRWLFMNTPKKDQTQRLKIKAAVISVLAGDIHDRHTTGIWLLLFKLLYYIVSVRTIKETLKFNSANGNELQCKR